MIGDIPDIDEIASRHLPLWQKATAANPSSSFVLTRRLLAAAIGHDLRVAESPNARRNHFDEYITLPGREIPIRVYGGGYSVEQPTVVYFHGGGWVSGNLDTHHDFCCLLREKLGGPVVSVHTRRAPENPFPAAIEDALSAIRFLESCNGLVDAGSAGLILAGDSAGAFVAFHAALALADSSRMKGLLLFYPALDPDVSKESYRLYAESPGLTAATMCQYWDALLGSDDRRRTALALDTLAGLDRLPPTAVMMAEFDPLRDDGTKLVSLLRDIGRPAISMTARGTTHGFCRLVKHDFAARALVEALLNKFGEFVSANPPHLTSP